MNNFYFNTSELKQRGWTKTMIERFLIAPDEVKLFNYRGYQGRKSKLYLKTRVELIEQSEAFQLFCKKKESRQLIANQNPLPQPRGFLLVQSFLAFNRLPESDCQKSGT